MKGKSPIVGLIIGGLIVMAGLLLVAAHGHSAPIFSPDSSMIGPPAKSEAEAEAEAEGQFPAVAPDNKGYWIYTKAQWDTVPSMTKEIVVTQWISGFIAGYPWALLEMNISPINVMMATQHMMQRISVMALHPKQMVARIETWYGMHPDAKDKPSVVFATLFTDFLSITATQ